MQTTQDTMKIILPDRKNTASLQGSLKELHGIVEMNNVNIEFGVFMGNLRMYTENIEDHSARSVFSAYFWRNMSVSDIRTLHGYNSQAEVIKALNKGTKAYIEMLIRDYGIK